MSNPLIGPDIVRHNVTMPDGHCIQFFVNRESGLVVVDYIHKNESGGTELFRKTLNPHTMLAHGVRSNRRKGSIEAFRDSIND